MDVFIECKRTQVHQPELAVFVLQCHFQVLLFLKEYPKLNSRPIDIFEAGSSHLLGQINKTLLYKGKMQFRYCPN